LDQGEPIMARIMAVRRSADSVLSEMGWPAGIFEDIEEEMWF